jgi:hypothetical protein
MDDSLRLPFEKERYQALLKLSERYGTISEAEKDVLLRSASTQYLGYSTSEKRPEVHATFLRWLATDKDAAIYIDPFGIRAAHASISDSLDLDSCKIPFPLRFDDCAFQREISLSHAQLPSLHLNKCETEAGIDGDGLTTTGDVFLRHVFSSGVIRFLGAQICGQLNCEGATLRATGNALIASSATITGGVYLTEGFSSTGVIHLINAEIGNQFVCTRATLTATDSALIADESRIKGSVFLKDGFNSAGTISLHGVRIGGELDCDGATLSAPDDGLIADEAKIEGGIFLRNGFSSKGSIRFPRAQIGSDFDCDGATLTATDISLNVEKARINGHVLLRYGFSSAGQVSLFGAEIGGGLNCTNSSIVHLDCTGMRLAGDLRWIGIRKPAISNPRGLGVYTTTFAILDLASATVATLYDDRASWPCSGRLHLQDFTYQDLVLCEEPEPRLQDSNLAPLLLPKDWDPPKRKLTASDRIEWLKRQPPNELANAQPWMQLARVLEANGDSDGAKQVIYEYSRQQVRPANALRRAASFPVHLLQKQPLWVLVPIAALNGLGSLVYWRAKRMRAMVPTEKEARTAFEKEEPLPAGYPPFNPFIYTFETILPVVKLGQEDVWTPDPHASPGDWLPGRPTWLRSFANRWRPTRWFFRLDYTRLAIIRWTLVILGWVLAGILTYAIGSRFEH